MLVTGYVKLKLDCREANSLAVAGLSYWCGPTFSYHGSAYTAVLRPSRPPAFGGWMYVSECKRLCPKDFGRMICSNLYDAFMIVIISQGQFVRGYHPYS